MQPFTSLQMKSSVLVTTRNITTSVRHGTNDVKRTCSLGVSYDVSRSYNVHRKPTFCSLHKDLLTYPFRLTVPNFETCPSAFEVVILRDTWHCRIRKFVR